VNKPGIYGEKMLTKEINLYYNYRKQKYYLFAQAVPLFLSWQEIAKGKEDERNVSKR